MKLRGTGQRLAPLLVATFGFLATLFFWNRSLSTSDLLIVPLFGDWNLLLASSDGTFGFGGVCWPEGDWFSLAPGYHGEPANSGPDEPPPIWGEFVLEFDPMDAVAIGLPWWIFALVGLGITVMLLWPGISLARSDRQKS